MVRINLLPVREILRRQYLKRFILFSCVALAGTVVLMIVCYIVADMRLSKLSQERSRLKKEQADLIQKNKEIDVLANEEAHLRRQLERTRKITKDRDSIERFMTAISLAIPDDVWLDSMEKAQNRDFVLNGKGADSSSIGTFVDNLQNMKSDFTEKSRYIDTSKKDEIPFFTDVKRTEVSAVAEGKDTAKGTMNFKIVGHLR